MSQAPEQSTDRGSKQRDRHPLNPALSRQSVGLATQRERVGLVGGHDGLSRSEMAQLVSPAPLASASQPPAKQGRSPPSSVTGQPTLASPTQAAPELGRSQAAHMFCLAEHGVSKESHLVANFEKSVDFT